MTRFLIPVILIGISVALFFTYTNPLYGEISQLREQMDSYNHALDNSKALENERDKLTQKFNSITSDNLDKLKKLLPENVDNIRLILEIEKIATPYGMALKDVRYSNNDAVSSTPATVQGGTLATASSKNYGVWNLQFSTSGTYNNFLKFIKDLESNLRIVDISSVSFNSDSGTGGVGTSSTGVYQYQISIKTYWLKN